MNYDDHEFVRLLENIIFNGQDHHQTVLFQLSEQQKIDIFRHYMEFVDYNGTTFRYYNQARDVWVKFEAENNERLLGIPVLKILFVFNRLGIFSENMTNERKAALLNILLQEPKVLSGWHYLVSKGVLAWDLSNENPPREGLLLRLPNNCHLSNGPDVKESYNQLRNLTGLNFNEGSNNKVISDQLNKMVYMVQKKNEEFYNLEALNGLDRVEFLERYPRVGVLDDIIFWTHATPDTLSLEGGRVIRKEEYQEWFLCNRFDNWEPVADKQRRFWKNWLENGTVVPDISGAHEHGDFTQSTLPGMHAGHIDVPQDVVPWEGDPRNHCKIHQLESLSNQAVENLDNGSLIFPEIPMAPFLSWLLQLILLLCKYNWAFLAWFKSKFK